MASTTEELTGQSDQLVSALSFFRTGVEEQRQHRPAASHVARPAPGSGSQSVKASGSGKSAAPRPQARGGVNLRLNDKHDDLDGEFERY
jgi:methyl-accepting chemotaxis protein